MSLVRFIGEALAFACVCALVAGALDKREESLDAYIQSERPWYLVAYFAGTYVALEILGLTNALRLSQISRESFALI